MSRLRIDREKGWLVVEIGTGQSALVHPVVEKRVVAAVAGLLRVARTAMPDTYFATDSRVRRGQKLLKMFGRGPVK